MNIYEELGLKKVINGSGKMTALGGSTVDPRVGDCIKEAAMNFVDIEALINRAGEIIANYTGGEDACITSSASAGIAISVAACIARDNLTAIERLPISEGLTNQVIMQKGHAINYGASIQQMIRLGGGIPHEVGQANKVEINHIKEAITEKTAALFYVKSHHTVQKGMVSIEGMIKIAKAHNLPLIIDGAAEEDLQRYIKLGADLVIYSGAKAIEGPTSGFITGRKDLINYCKLQYKGIGRAMKIGKENIMGLLKAIDLYSNKDNEEKAKEHKQNMEWLVGEINKIKELKATLTQDEAGRDIHRTEIRVDSDTLGVNADYIISKLENGNPAIYTRNHYANIGIINIDPRPLQEGEEKLILKKLKEIINSL
ncbi:DgaE family pyridoxal phosphate-dependent ammonia lyase [Alkaliphilus peptidifermentans]|uniref:D-glucosaminate-6-phosphate ammonia-lyase n=1 Tax=Alkaliphilus peptidifermentans DSM 18978 TaxID=1120976 RepID=A0A1G5ISS2_9FIRM|nr:DgaE family pyridoxal phosphate-dependent ammonia lyase [Alkaliphilus peptidifermentans]SCY78944.1 D-glucosaminate-6-phosphate ammonia-lyase [Alkaliphilus peptidifermentans DSM 18978]